VAIGALDWTSDFPTMKYAACKGHGMAAQFDLAAQGNGPAIEKCLVTCNLCPERPGACSSFAATQPPRELARLGVVAGVAYVTPSRPPGRQQQAKPA
jgi:hypothetical protein